MGSSSYSKFNPPPVQLLHKRAAALDTLYQVKNDLACNLIVTEQWQVNNSVSILSPG